ncbi:OmpA family protein [Arenibaculum pallidiluteum]|uniref:hypothetical protein n=1 Tax=Arenibaculum pallidiluteum TaxID=2812559 RepID=UPI001A95DAE8|nr:hypothetical protein [Arenibaculum pallidiluteum]
MTIVLRPVSQTGATHARRMLGRRAVRLAAFVLIVAVSGCASHPDATTAVPAGDRPGATNGASDVVQAPATGPRAAAVVPAGLPVPADPVLPPAPDEALSLDQAVQRAAMDLFASVPPAVRTGRERRLLVIDPLVDGATGGQTGATRSMQRSLAAYVEDRQHEYELRPLDTAALNQAPLVLVGSVRGVGRSGLAPGIPEAYRIWFSLADLRSGMVVGHGMAWARPDTVDQTPTAFFRDSPAWLVDARTQGYLRTCLSKVGAPVDPAYLDGILAAALAADGVQAYEGGQYEEALELFQSSRRLPGGDQLDVLNGLHLVYGKLGRPGDAEAAFSELVDFGLRHERLAMKMLFKPSSTAYWHDPASGGRYDMWLRQIARRTEPSGKCLELVGHTSPTGPLALNEKLSHARAETVRVGLAKHVLSVGEEATTRGAGSTENLVGTGADDASDALDRRVEFRPFVCPDTGREAGASESRSAS